MELWKMEKKYMFNIKYVENEIYFNKKNIMFFKFSGNAQVCNLLLSLPTHTKLLIFILNIG